LSSGILHKPSRSSACFVGRPCYTSARNNTCICYFVCRRVPLCTAGIKRRTLNGLWEAVKCTLVQALRLCTGRTAHSRSRGIALIFHDNGSRRGWGVSVTPRPLFTPRKDPVPIVQEALWAPGPIWTGAENLAPTGIRSPDRAARDQSLYRLRYAAYCGRH
jgi:hypothetical protein